MKWNLKRFKWNKIYSFYTEQKMLWTSFGIHRLKYVGRIEVHGSNEISDDNVYGVSGPEINA